MKNIPFETGKSGAEEAFADLVFGLEIKGGKAFLCLDSTEVSPWLKVDRLEMILPGFSFPFNFGSGLGRFRQHLCKLTKMNFTIDMAGFVEDLCKKRDLEKKGISLRAFEGGVLAFGELCIGPTQIPFSLVFSVSLMGSKFLIAAEESYVYGNGSLPSSLVVASLLGAIGGGDESSLVSFRLLSADVVGGGFLDALLWEVLLPRGWKVPEIRDFCQTKLEWKGTDLKVSFADYPSGERHEGGKSSERIVGGDNGERACREGEEEDGGLIQSDQGGKPDGMVLRRQHFVGERAILDGRIEDAFEYYWSGLKTDPEDKFVVGRALDLGQCFPSYRAEVIAFTNEKIALWPEWDPAFLVMGAIHLAQGEILQAVIRFSQVISRMEEKGRHEDAFVGSLACGKLLSDIDPEQAMGWYSRALRHNPDNLEAQWDLANLYRKSERWHELIALLRNKAMKGDKDERVTAHVELGRCHIDCFSDYLRARAEFEKAIRMDEKFIPAWMGLADVYLSVGEAKKTLASLERVESLLLEQEDVMAVFVSVHVKKSIAFKLLGKKQEAEESIEEALKKEPDDDEVQRAAIEVFHEMKRWDALLEVLRRRVERDNTNPQERQALLTRMAEVEVFERKDIGAGKLVLDEALEIGQSSLDALKLAVEVAELTGNTADQISYLSKMIQLEKNERKKAVFILQRASVFLNEHRDVDSIIDDLHKVSELGGKEALSALEILVEIYRKRGDKENLIKCLALWMESVKGKEKENTSFVLCSVELAELLFERGEGEDKKKALRYLIGAADLNPGSAEPLRKMALFLEALDDQQGLESVLQRLVSLLRRKEKLSELGKTLAWLGKVRLSMGRPEQAGEALREAYRLEPEDPDIMRLFAEAEYRSGVFEQAGDAFMRLWNRGTGESLERAETAYKLGKIFSAEGDLDKTAEFFRAALDYGFSDKERAKECRQEICDAFVTRERWEEAARAYQNMADDSRLQLSAEERASILYTAVELFHKRLDRNEESIHLCYKVLDLRPDHHGALNTLEFLHGKLQQYEKQAKVIQNKIKLTSLHKAEKTALFGRLGKLQSEELGKRESARRSYEEALSLDKDFFPALLFLARDDWENGHWEGVWRRYGRLLEHVEDHKIAVSGEKNRLSVEIYSRRVRAALEMDWEEELEENAQWVLKNDPGNKDVLKLLDEYFFKRGDWSSLVGILRRRAELATGDQGVSIRLRLGEILAHEMGEVQQAAEVYRDVLREDPLNLVALNSLSQILGEEKRPKERLKVLERLLSILDKNPEEGEEIGRKKGDLLREMGATAFQLQKKAKGKKWILRCLAEDPKDREAAEILVSFERKRGSFNDLDEALALWSRTLDDPSLSRSAQLERVRLYLEKNEDPQRALKIINDMNEEERSKEEIALKGEILERLGEWEGSFSCYEELAEGAEDTKKEVFWRRKLFDLALAQMEDDETAELQGMKILEQEPEHPEVAGAMADIYKRQNDEVMWRRMMERRIKAFEKDETKVTDKTDAIKQLVVSWKNDPQGELHKAEELCLRVLDDLPNDTDTLELLYDVRLQSGEVEKSVETLERLIKEMEKQNQPEGRQILAERYLELAGLFVDLNNIFAARQSCKEALSFAEGDFRDTVLEKWLDFAQKDEQWEEVIKAAQQIGEARQTPPNLWALSVAYESLSRVDDAISVLKILQEKKHDHEDLKERLRKLYLQSGRHHELAKEYQRDAELAESDEDKFQLLMDASTHFASTEGGGDEAVGCLLKAWSVLPGDHRVAGVLRSVLSRPSDKTKLMELLVVAAQDERAAKSDRSMILLYAAEQLITDDSDDRYNEDAEKFLSESIMLDPENVVARTKQRELLYKKESWGSLCKVLTDWIDHAEDKQELVELGIELADVYIDKTQDFNSAVSVLEKLPEEGRDGAFFALLAGAYEAAGRLQEAEAALLKRVTYEDEAWPVCLKAADLSAQRGDYLAERGWLRDALGSGGPPLEIAERLVSLEREEGDRESLTEALKDLVKIITDPDRKALILKELAQLIKEIDPEKSLQLYSEVLLLTPNDTALKSEFAEFALEQQELELALDELSSLHEKLPLEARNERGHVSVRMAVAMADVGGDKEASRDLFLRAADEFEDQPARLRALRRTLGLAQETKTPGLEEEITRLLIEELDEEKEVVVLKRRLMELVLGRDGWREVLSLSEELRETNQHTTETLKQEAIALETLSEWGRAADVWVECSEMEGIDPETKVEFLMRGVSLLRDRMEDPEKALFLSKKALEIKPDDLSVYETIDALCQRYELWEDLLWVKERSMRGRDSAFKTKTLHAMAVIADRRLNDSDQAATLLAKAHGMNPEFYPVMRPLGEYHFRLREWAPAKDYFLQALKDPELSDSGRVEVLDRLSRIERAEGDFRKEQQYVLEAAKIHPSRDDLWERAQGVLERCGDDKELFEVLKTRAEMAKGTKKIKHLTAAAVLADQQLGIPEEAVKIYESIVEMSPDSLIARGRLLELLRERGDWDRLKDRLRSEVLLLQGAGRAKIAEELASLYESSDDIEKAEHYWRMAYREEPGDPKRIRAVADCLAKHHKWQDLTDFLEMALDTVALPDNALSGFMALLGRTYFEKLGAAERALDVFERAGMRNALTARSAKTLAQIYRVRERYHDLAELLESQKEIAENEAVREELLEELGELYSGELNKPLEAATVFKDLFEKDTINYFDKGLDAINLLVKANKYEEAEEVARKVAKHAPGERKAEAELSWGLILLDYLGQEENALQILLTAVDKRPDLSMGHLAIGRILFTWGDLDRAAFHLEIVADGEINDKAVRAEAHQLAGSAAEELNRIEEAKRHYEEALELDPTNIDVLRLLDRLYTSLGCWKDLSAVLGKEIVLEADPETKARLWYRRALLYRDILDDQSEALRCLKEAVAASPNLTEAVSALRQSVVVAGDWSFAGQLILREIASQSNQARLAELFISLGKLYEEKLHKPQKALEAYQEALEKDTKNPEPAESLARVLAHQGRWQEAGFAIEELVIRRVGVDKGPLFLKAANFFKRGDDLERARHVLLRVLRETQTEYWPDAIDSLLGFVSKKEEREEAVSVLEKCLENLEDVEARPALLRGLTRILVDLDRPEDAQPYVEEILERSPEDRSAFIYQRKILEQKGAHNQLRKLLEKRLSIAPKEESSDLLFALGDLLYSELNDLEGASIAYDKLLDLDENNRAVLDVRGDLAYREGDFESAGEFYDRLGDGPSRLGEDRLFYRRGEIAEAVGEENRAIVFYQKAVAKNPSFRESLEALARIFLFHDKKEDAADVLTKLWELIPVEEYKTVRSIGIVFVELLFSLNRLDEAKSVLDRLQSLESKDSTQLWALFLKLHEKNENWLMVAEALEQLSLLSEDPRERVKYLYKEGEVLSLQVGDEKGAIERYLKAADLIPSHLPTAGKLAEYYSRTGEWRQLIDVFHIILDNETREKEKEAARLGLATAMLLAGGDEAVKAPEVLRMVNPQGLDSKQVVKVLADGAVGLRALGYTMTPMGRVLDGLNSAFGDEMLRKWSLTARRIGSDFPWDLGCRRLLPRLEAREAHRKTALEHTKVLAFLDPEDPAVGDTAAWPKLGKLRDNVLDVEGVLCPKDLMPALRKVLVCFAEFVSGFPNNRHASEQDRGEAIEKVLSQEHVGRVRDLIKRLRVPNVKINVSRQGGVFVRLVDSSPPEILIAESFLERPIEEILFVLAEKLEWVRSGSLLFLNRKAEESQNILFALAVALGINVDTKKIISKLVSAWKDRIDDSLDKMRNKERERVVESMQKWIGGLGDLETYLKEQERMAKRVGLMVCGDLRSALKGAALEATGRSDVLDPSNVVERKKLLEQKYGMAELVRYGVSQKRKKLFGSSTMTGY